MASVDMARTRIATRIVQVGEVQLPTTVPQVLVRTADDSLLVGAHDGVFALAPDHRIAWHVATPGFVLDVRQGPAADEVSVVSADGVAVYGHDGRQRRSAPSDFELVTSERTGAGCLYAVLRPTGEVRVAEAAVQHGKDVIV